MKKYDMTLVDVFLSEQKEFGEETNHKLRENEYIQQLQKKIDARIHEKKVPAVVDKISAYLVDMLDVSLKDILINSWKKYATIAEALERSKKKPTETIFLTLAKHKIVSEHYPYIEINLNEEAIEKIIFDIKLQLILEGFVLEIKNSEIVAIETGNCQGTGKVAYKDIIFFEEKSKKIELPGKIILFQ